MILFVCSQGRIRSRTAEVLALAGGCLARSCGTDADALVPVSDALLKGAQLVVCMEQVHARKVKSYPAAQGKPVVTLSIEDVWNPFDPMLVDQLINFCRHRLSEDWLADALQRGADHLSRNNIDFLIGTKHGKTDARTEGSQQSGNAGA